MSLISEIAASLLPGRIVDIRVGYSRTAVLAESELGLTCGLAATLANPDFQHRQRPSVEDAGRLLDMSLHELAGLAESDSHTEASIGIAVINALAPRHRDDSKELGAEEYLRKHAHGKNVAMVGHFPFAENIKPELANLWVLELNPRPGDLPAERAPEFIPKADVVAITATALINQTLEELLVLCHPPTKVMLIGPSTPLSPVLFAHGVDLLCGTVVLDPKAVMLGISQGASSHQLHQAGHTRQVVLEKQTEN